MSTSKADYKRPALPPQAELEGLIGHALDHARGLGASAAEAGVSVDIGLSVTVRMGEVETLEFHYDRGLGVSLYFGQRKGSASTSDLSPEAIRSSVEAAAAIARYTNEDPYTGPAAAEDLATEIPELDLFHPWDISAPEAIERALACEGAARALDGRITNSEGATLSAHQGLRVFGNSLGFLGGYPSSRHSVSCAVIGEQDGAMQRDYWYTEARRPQDLEDAEGVGRRAAERTLRRLGARRLGTRSVPVLFVPEMARGLLRSLVGAVRGSALYRRASFLVDHAGRQILPQFVHLHEQPHLPRALGSAPFDSEGVATRARDLVLDGVLQGYVLDSYSARRLGLRTTGNAGGTHNLTLDPGPMDQDGLLREMGTGLMVTELMGQGTNLVTGDYSRGAAGFWVEDGEVQYPVEEITIAGNLRDMLRNLVAVGRDVDERASIRTGSVLLDSMTVAGE